MLEDHKWIAIYMKILILFFFLEKLVVIWSEFDMREVVNVKNLLVHKCDLDGLRALVTVFGFDAHVLRVYLQ